ncbi:MAG: hypothetical protein ACFFCP_01050 [Promethearchaeota archaeon]
MEYSFVATGAVIELMHLVAHRNHNIRVKMRNLEVVQRLQLMPGCMTSMTSDCPDGLCRMKIQAVDRAIGHQKNEWLVLLSSTKDSADVALALRFCEAFHLESKVRVKSDGYQVLARDDLQRIV